jgi:membrane-bound lytic murein transglycosylase B
MNLLFRSCLLTLLLTFTCVAEAAHNFAQRADVRSFITEMHGKHNFSTRQLTLEFAHIRPLPAVIKAVQPPRDPCSCFKVAADSANITQLASSF